MEPLNKREAHKWPVYFGITSKSEWGGSPESEAGCSPLSSRNDTKESSNFTGKRQVGFKAKTAAKEKLFK